MSEQPRKTPLVELLRSVPRDAVWVFSDVMSMSSYPVGKWCHEAAAEITGHEAAKFACMRDNEALREKLGRLLGFILGWTKDVGLPQLQSWDEAIGDAEQHIYDLRGALRAESDIAAQAMQERDAYRASSEIRGENIEYMHNVLSELSAMFAGQALGCRQIARELRKMARLSLDCSP